MDFLIIVIIGLALSFDTFAVSVSCGIAECKIKFWEAVRIATFFAIFQALMPVLGWLLGSTIKDYVLLFDHWIAFGLLSFLGVKMILESFKKEDEKTFNPHKLRYILTMSFATTIDAFIVGFTFAFGDIKLVLSAFIIGTITFIIAMLGMLFGKKIGSGNSHKFEILGGLILISIGLKILFEHIL